MIFPFSGSFAALTAYIEARKAGLKGGFISYVLVGVFLVISFSTIGFVQVNAPSYSIAIGHYITFCPLHSAIRSSIFPLRFLTGYLFSFSFTARAGSHTILKHLFLAV